MGGAVSTGDDNDELVDNLVDADYIKSLKTERIFRAVDRADYFLPDHRESAYKDLAWKHGHLHLSAPCIYSEVLESLELEEGQSFLNLGSGTGYLSTMAGLILGTYGVNHGVEVHEDVVEYARAKLEEFKAKTKAFEEFDFSEPQFVVGNCLQLNSACRLYDRVYCGAACPSEHENYMRNLIKVGGILVMPLNDQLLQIRRVAETDWTSKNVLPVSFATLVAANKDKTDVVDLPDCQVLSLQDVCRHNIRRIIRDNICLEYPNIKRSLRKQRPPRPKMTGERRGRLVNLVPMQMGMMILDNFDNSNDDIDDDEDDDDDDDDDDDRVSNDGSGPSKNSDDENSATHDDDHDGGEGEGELKTAEAASNGSADVHPKDKFEQKVKRKPRQDYIKEEPEIEAAAESQSDEPSTNNGTDSDSKPSLSSSSTDNKRSSPSSLCQEAQGDNASKRMRCVDTREEEAGKDDDHAEEGNGLNSSPIRIEQRSQRPQRDLSLEDSDMENMDMDQAATAFQAPATPTSVLNALHLLSIPRKFRCSSSTSADTSETSGFGSFGEEPLDLPGMGGDRDSPPSSVEEEEEDAGLEEGLASLTHKIVIAKTSSKGEASGESASTEKYEGPTLAQLMKERIKLLPMPHALRSYLAYYRD